MTHPTDALRLVPDDHLAALIQQADDGFGYSMEMVRLVDGVRTYRLKIEGQETVEITDGDDNDYDAQQACYRLINAAKNKVRADAVRTALAAAPASPLPGGGSNHLGNLLARIHRDGGHRQEEVGTDQACDEAELIVARLLQNDHQWRRIDTFAGSGQGDPVIVAVPTKEGGWIVGEAWKSVMEPDDPYRGNDGWWWAGTELGDAYNDPIRFMNHGDAEWWMPLPAAPTGDA